MPLAAVYESINIMASSAPGGKNDSGKKAVLHIENLPLLLTSGSLESLSTEEKWLPQFMRQAIVRSISNRIAGLLLVGTSAFLVSCTTTLARDNTIKLTSVELLFWRSLVSWLLTLVAIAATGTAMRVKKEFYRPLVLRCITGCTTMILTIIVLQNVAVSNATVITYFSPLLAFVLAAFFLNEKPRVFEVGCSMVCVVGAVLVVRPAFLFGKNGSTDTKWYRRSMTSFVTSYSVRRVVGYWKVPHLVVMHYFLLATTLVSLAAIFCFQQYEKAKTGGLSLETWGAILGTGALTFAEQLFLTRGFQFDGAGVLAATRLLHVGCEFVWSVVLLGTALNAWSAGGAATTAAGVLFLALHRVHNHWAVKRNMRRMLE
ncbi:unnamed protein product [Peronospora effusa]|nr:unnamed protein product [Peronospora effusa]